MALGNTLSESLLAGVALTNGQIVRVSANDTAALAFADSLANLVGVVGVVQTSQDIAAGGRFNAVTAGGAVTVLVQTGLTLSAGDTLYVSETVAGRATNVAPGTNAIAIGTIQSTAAYATNSTVKAIVDIGMGVGSNSSNADWALTVCRYYLVDYVNGLDTNRGFVDAAPGATFTPATLQALALKTIEELLTRIPRQGAGRQVVVLLRGDAAASAPVIYYNKDGVTISNVDFSGFAGYGTFVFRASDFTNDAADKVRCATYVPAAAAGPGAGGLWTVQSFTAPEVTVAAGTLNTTLNTLEGLSVDWTGNVTATLAANPGVLKWVRTSSVFEVGIGGGGTVINPANGDTFLITAPSVVVGTIRGLQNNFQTIGAGTRMASIAVVGVEVRAQAADAGTWKTVLNLLTFAKCHSNGYFSISLSAGLGFQFTGVYVDEGGTTRTTSLSMAFKSAASVVSVGMSGVGNVAGIPGSSTMVGIVVCSGLGARSAMRLDGIIGSSEGSGGGLALLNRSAIHGRLSANSIRLGDSSFGIAFTLGASSAYFGLLVNADATVTNGALSVSGGNCIRLGFIRFAGTGVDCVSVIGGENDVDMSSLTLATGAVYTGYGLNLVGRNTAQNNRVVNGGSNTISGSLGEILFDTGVIKTWASITEGFINSQGTSLILRGQTVNYLKKLTIGSLANAPVLAADPASPVDGDVWVKDTGGVRTINVRIGGVTYATTLT